MTHPSSLDAALLRFDALTRDSTPADAPRLPGFLAGYFCATQEVPVVLRFGYCGTDQDSFRVGHREGTDAITNYKRQP